MVYNKAKDEQKHELMSHAIQSFGVKVTLSTKVPQWMPETTKVAAYAGGRTKDVDKRRVSMLMPDWLAEKVSVMQPQKSYRSVCLNALVKLGLMQGLLTLDQGKSLTCLLPERFETPTTLTEQSDDPLIQFVHNTSLPLSAQTRPQKKLISVFLEVETIEAVSEYVSASSYSEAYCGLLFLALSNLLYMKEVAIIGQPKTPNGLALGA